MPVNPEKYNEIKRELALHNVELVAVSKTRTPEEIHALYDLGHRDFGENYVQELVDKAAALPKDIRWHFIGHLQGNKVKFLAPFVQLIQGVDSLKLLKEIQKQGAKQNRILDCLLQVHIAMEETKFGLDETELKEAIEASFQLQNVSIRGLMGMASFTEDQEIIRSEFQYLHKLFDTTTRLIKEKKEAGNSPFILSMGMSSDYRIAIAEGSNMVRIGSLLFGPRS